MDAWNSKVKTRKNHQCFGCLGIIPAGSIVVKWAGISEGDFSHGYTCGICSIILEDFDCTETYYEGDLLNEDWDDAAKKYEERTGNSYTSVIIPLKHFRIKEKNESITDRV